MTLYENGLYKEATELYESIMIDALEHQNDRAALHAGYKLLCMLISHEEGPAARHAIDELKPIMARNQKLIETQFVHLSEMDLLRLEGKGEMAITSLREFIDRVDQPSPILLGSAHRRIADALCHSGELDQANFHAKKCVDLLHSVAYKATDAFLTLANVHFLQRDYQSVLEPIRLFPSVR